MIKEIIANTTKIAEGNLKVELDTKNQYGEDEVSEGATLRIKEGTAKLNEMPLTADEIKVEGNTVKLISKDESGEDNKSSVTFKEGDKVEFVVEATYKAEAEDENTEPEVTATSEKFEYTIQAAEDAKPVKIEALTATAQVGDAESVTVKQGDKVEPKSKVTLTADVRDQFNNKVTGADIRWVVTEGKELLGEETQKITVNNTQKLEVEALLPGKVTVEAYNIANGAKQTFSFEIDKTHIEELNWDAVEPLKVVNKEEATLGTLTVNKGADFSAEQVEFKVEALDKEGNVLKDEDGKPVVVSEDDVKVVAVDEKIKDENGEVAEDAETEVVVKVITNKPGNYKITPIVKGTEITAEPKKVTSEVKSEIASIEIDYTAKADGEKVEKGLEIPVVFKNIHEEEIELTKEQLKDVTIASSNKDIQPTLEEVKVKGEDGQLEGTGKYVLKFAPQVKGEDGKLTGVQAGKTIVTLQSGNAISEPIQVTFVEAELTTIKVADEKLEGLIANDGEAVYTDLTFFDQHEEEMNAAENLEFKVKLGEEEVTDVQAEVVEVYTDEEGNIVEVNDESPAPAETKTRKAVKVTADSEDSAIKPGDYTVEVSVKDNEKVEPVTFTVEVKEAREVKDIKAEPKSSTVALGSPVTVDVTVTDQYGEAFNLPADEEITAELIDPETEEATEDKVNVTAVEGKDGKYTATVTPEKLGTYDLVFTYTKGDDEEEVKVTETVSVHVGIAADVVKSIEFADFEDEETERVLIKDGKPVYDYSTQGQKYTLTPKAKDADGNPVNFNAEELTWTSSNTDLVTVNGGEVEVVGTPTEDTEVTVTAKMLDVSQSITFVVSADSTPKALPESITMTVPTEEATLEVTEVTIDENATDGAIEVTYTAVDQFGKDFTVDFTDTKIESFNPTVATAVKGSDNNTIKITAVGEGETKIRTTIDGNDVDLNVIVTKEAVEAKKAADAADKALNTAKDALKDKEAEDYTTETWEKVTEAQELPEGTTEEKNAKAEAINEAVKGLKTKAAAEAEEADAALQQAVDSIPEDLDEEGKYTTDSVQAVKDAQAKPEETTEEKNTKTEAINNAVEGLKLQAKADQEAVDAALEKVKDSYEAAEGTEDTADKKIAAVKEAVEKDVANEEVKVEITEEDGTFTVTLTKGDAEATKDITITIAE